MRDSHPPVDMRVADDNPSLSSACLTSAIVNQPQAMRIYLSQVGEALEAETEEPAEIRPGIEGEDLAAITALRNGDFLGLEPLVRRYQLRAVRTAYAITGDRLLAEDLAAEAFLKAVERVGQYDRSRPFAPWFFRIVVNDAVKAVRRHQRLQVRLGRLAADVKPHEAWSDPEGRAIAEELHELVVKAIRTLPPKQRAAVVLKYYLDFDEAAIARTMGSPRGTVKARLHLARVRLRKSLNLEGIGGELA